MDINLTMINQVSYSYPTWIYKPSHDKPCILLLYPPEYINLTRYITRNPLGYKIFHRNRLFSIWIFRLSDLYIKGIWLSILKLSDSEVFSSKCTCTYIDIWIICFDIYIHKLYSKHNLSYNYPTINMDMNIQIYIIIFIYL